MRERSAWVWAAVAALVVASGCQDRDAQRVPADGSATPPLGGQAAQTPDRQAELRLEITLSERQLRVYRGGELRGTHEVAVGDETEYPTPTGEYTIHQVDWNPDWRPPDSDWAADEEYREPGHPENPMGRARLIFEEPYSIHGTDDVESLGRDASHGSVRVANEVVLELARLVMEASGDGESEEWYREARENRTEMRQVRLSRPVPLTIRE